MNETALLQSFFCRNLFKKFCDNRYDLLDHRLCRVDANVAPENEDQLQKAMEELTRNKTIIMIAHRLKTVRNADQILVVNNGNIVQQGKHSELIKQKGIYADFILGREEAIGWKLKSVPSANDKKTS